MLHSYVKIAQKSEIWIVLVRIDKSFTKSQLSQFYFTTLRLDIIKGVWSLSQANSAVFLSFWDAYPLSVSHISSLNKLGTVASIFFFSSPVSSEGGRRYSYSMNYTSSSINNFLVLKDSSSFESGFWKRVKPVLTGLSKFVYLKLFIFKLYHCMCNKYFTVHSIYWLYAYRCILVFQNAKWRIG